MALVTRRRFIQGSAATGGVVAANQFVFKKLDMVAAAAGSAQETAPVDDVVNTTCWIGKQDCGIVARRVNGRVVKLEGHPDNPLNLGTLCPKGQAQIISFYDPNRVKTPLVRTNAKGQTGTWRPATWDEALGLVAEQVNEVRARNPKLVLWQKGRSKAKLFYDDAFTKAIGSSKMGHGAYCSDTGYRALEYTLGLHGVLHPDFKHTEYLLSWGWNITNAGGNKFCWITWPRQMLAARNRGMKIVHIDPRLRSAGPYADRWLPIRPASDLAMALALCHVLVAEDFLDVPYLTTWTNAPWLVGADGLVLRVDGAPQVWDEATGTAVPVGTAQQPALEGSHRVDGVTYRTAFELFRQHVEQYTPEWAADITGLTAEQIRTVGVEFGQHARIGSTITVDGVELPHRPVAIMAYHMAQQELGFQAVRAMTMLTMLVGAPGAVGGQFADTKWEVYKNYDKFEDIQVGEPPYDFMLNGSRFFPINTGMPGVVAKVMADPAAWDVEDIPEVCIVHMANPLVSFADQATMAAGYEKFRFVAVISPWLSETADHYADVILPAATIEKYEGPISANDQYVDAKTLRLPPMDPLFESKGEIDIYLDLCAAMGTLTGPDGYIDQINQALELEGEFALPLGRRPEVRDIFDRWSRMEGLEGGIEFFEKHGIWVKGPVKPTAFYGYAADPPFGGAVHRLYGESLLIAQTQMKDKGAPEAYWQDYTALPTWRPPTMESSPDEFGLYLISYKLVEHKQGRTSFVPLLGEIAPRSRLDINPATAREFGVRDGEPVWVESHNAVTGETRRVQTIAAFTEAIRPDTVGMPHHFGLWASPESRDRGPSPNTIYYAGEGYTGATADQSFHVKVRVRPVEGGEA